jgi:protein SCO1/2
LKKRTKKLLLVSVRTGRAAASAKKIKVFCFFFSKKKYFLALPVSGLVSGYRIMKSSAAARRKQRDRKSLVFVTAGAATILVLASLFLWLGTLANNSRTAENQIGGPFSLIDDRGNPVTDRSYPGKYLLIYFGYASCPDICPATLNTLAASLGRLGQKADRVQPLFITIDPTHDTPAILHHYVAAFSTKPIGLTGTKAELDKIAGEYRVVRIPHPGPGDRSSFTLDHSSVLYLMAPDGTFIAPIPADASELVMAQAIARNIP